MIFRSSIFHFEDLHILIDGLMIRREILLHVCVFSIIFVRVLRRVVSVSCPGPHARPPNHSLAVAVNVDGPHGLEIVTSKIMIGVGRGVREFDTHASYLQFCEGECESAWEQLRYFNGQMMFMLMICLSLSG